MNDEERRIITQYVERVAGAAPAQAGPAASPWGGSVPATQPARPTLPPVDREADALIADLFTRYPEARYRITQTAFVQEAALVEAQNRIRRLEWELENAKQQAQAAQQPARGGLFGGMFGGGGAQRPAAPMSPPPQPVYPPGYNPGMLQQRGGSSFLGTALTTAAGVAGGMVLGNMLMNAFSGHGGAAHAAGFDAGNADFAQEAVPASSPWTDPGSAAADQGWGSGGQDAYAAPDATGAGYDDGGNAGYADNAGYQNDDSGAGGFDDAGGGYDDEV
ncbi:DUF2076 domain-containing protein [Roseicella frigidaeris]|uniref:DUF2076 domain-containing protein n=1 Tax=Roseicella frigidaeris TaxID=2230885 RepID=A0A327MBM7_9PROT|nr:DUF2076 family protein [Roseicella frigidaeris]RAI60069.1 DUF2076 domain-containing protein [Roseicella frigidaeris]